MIALPGSGKVHNISDAALAAPRVPWSVPHALFASTLRLALSFAMDRHKTDILRAARNLYPILGFVHPGAGGAAMNEAARLR